jgi:hypothetical protein
MTQMTVYLPRDLLQQETGKSTLDELNDWRKEDSHEKGYQTRPNACTK